MSILKELYYGNIEPANRLMKRGGEYERITRQLVKDEEALVSLLTAEAKGLQEKMVL